MECKCNGPLLLCSQSSSSLLPSPSQSLSDYLSLRILSCSVFLVLPFSFCFLSLCPYLSLSPSLSHGSLPPSFPPSMCFGLFCLHGFVIHRNSLMEWECLHGIGIHRNSLIEWPCLFACNWDTEKVSDSNGPLCLHELECVGSN